MSNIRQEGSSFKSLVASVKAPEVCITDASPIKRVWSYKMFKIEHSTLIWGFSEGGF